MNVPEHTPITEDSALPNPGEHRETAATVSETAGPSARVETLGRDDKTKAGAPPDRGPQGVPGSHSLGWSSPAVGGRVGDNPSGPVKLCLHAREDGDFCGRPALRERLYCYQHLRLRGQQMRMARARAQRLACALMLPALDDLNAVKAALTQVTWALTSGLLERRSAGLLLYALQQAATNLWRIELIQMNSARSPQQSGQASEASEQKRRVEEYPGFEAEFGLPKGLDLSVPPEVLFPPPTKEAAGESQPQPHPSQQWVADDIELEQLDKQRPYLDEKTYSERSGKIRDRIRNRVQAVIRKERVAEWEAEAGRRNQLEEAKARIWNSMDLAQQRAFQLGIVTGIEEEQQRAADEARERKPVAGGDASIPDDRARSNSA